MEIDYDNYAYDIYRYMTERDVLACYVGDINHKTNTSLLQNIKKKMDRIDSDPSIKKKLINVMVECLENINRHSSTEVSNAIFMLCQNENYFQVITGNQIHKDDLDLLTNKIESINLMERNELRNLYNQIISEGALSEKGGAGVGLIDIVLKSGSKLEYETRELINGLSFFILKAKILNNTNNNRAV